MKKHMRVGIPVILFCSVIPSLAQTVPYSPAQLQLSGFDTRGSGVSAGTSSTVLAFTVEGDTTGNNTFEIATSDPGVAVSLILPSGTEITTANASSFGFTFTVIAEGNLPVDELQSAFSLPGTHTLIQVPSGQPSGTYHIKANASGVSADSGIIGTYYSSSTVRAAATTNSANYKVGDTVVLSGLIFDETSPITGAAVTATVSAPVSLSAQTSLSNYQLVSQQSVNSSLVDYTYSVTLTNTGSAVKEVRAQLASLPANVAVLNDTLVFGDVAASSTTTSTNTIIIERDPSQSFDPSTLQWNVTNPGLASNVSFSDSGPFDAARGDGVYTGSFVPTSTGTYTAFLSITGTSLAGSSFSRTAVTKFQVTQPLAGFVSFADAQTSGGITVTADVNVQTAGTYNFGLQLQASNQNIVQGVATATLSTGTQQISVTFPNTAVFGLGVNGPYERISALLTLQGSSGVLIADSRADAGPTAPYGTYAFSPGLFFTGNNAATIAGTSNPSTSVLQVQMGIFTTQGGCNWSARLSGPNGSQIDFVSGSGVPNAGSQFVTLSFDGNKIAQSSSNGPFQVSAMDLQCGSLEIGLPKPFMISGFTASQFTNIAPGYSLTANQSSASVSVGNTNVSAYVLTGATIGPFSGLVSLSLSGVPANVTATLSNPTLASTGVSTISLTAASNATLGTYPLTLTYSNVVTSKTLALSLTVTSVPITVTVVPPNGFSTGPGSTVQFQASVNGTLNTAVTWSLSSPIGSISSTGLYTVGSVTSEQSLYIIAKSVVDPSVVGFYLITLEPQITVNPGSAVLYPNQPTQQFTVSLIGLSSGVTWSISPAVGSIDPAAGLYTAPSSITTQQVITVTATSQSDSTKSGSTTLTLLPVAVGISGPQPVIVVPQTQQFYASVAGSSNQSVTWSLQAGDVGTINTSGLYTPPGAITNPAIVHVTATSVAYPSASRQDVLTLVNANSLESFTLAFTGQTGLYSGSVTSYLPAGASGMNVALSSGSPGITTMPSSVLIPAFSASTAPFLVAISAGNTAVAITSTGPSNSLLAVTQLDVTGQVSSPQYIMVYNRFTKLYSQSVKITNTSAATINGPLQYILNNLTPGWTFTNQTGTTGAGIPYFTTNTSLAPAASVTFTIYATRAGIVNFNYTAQILSGSF